MACFIAPLAEAVIVSSIEKRKHSDSKLKLLCSMLYGGSIFLMIEHIYNGEFFVMPNLGMLNEFVTKGIPMALLVTLAWLTICKFNIKLPSFTLPIIGTILMCFIDVVI